MSLVRIGSGKLKGKKNPLQWIIFNIVFLMVFQFIQPSFSVDETPELILRGLQLATAIRNNLDFTDVKESNTWSTEAIYEMSALGFMKGYGRKNFGKNDFLTKEQALAIIYSAIGREEEAIIAGERLNSARLLGERKTIGISMWSDGYLQLASNDGLISPEDFREAILENDPNIEPTFQRDAPAQRQEMAVWVSRLLQLEPKYDQIEIFNEYKDWETAIPENIPYIERVIFHKIMNGDGNGNFFPTRNLSREEAAQILKNASTQIFEKRSFNQRIGTIEGIETSVQDVRDEKITKKIINVRSNNGNLHQIELSKIEEVNGNQINEVSRKIVDPFEEELIVFKNYELGNSNLLREGDKIEYILDSNNQILYVKIHPERSPIKHILAQIKNIDPTQNFLEVYEIFDLDSSEMNLEELVFSFDEIINKPIKLYTLSNAVKVFHHDFPSDLSKIEPDQIVVITLVNQVGVQIKRIDFGNVHQEKGVFSGIVEINDLTTETLELFKIDRNTPMGKDVFGVHKEVEVFRNQQTARINDIVPGDRVFIKLDAQGKVIAMSGMPHYVLDFGKILSKSSQDILVEFDDGRTKKLQVNHAPPIYKNNNALELDGLKVGDRVKLLLQVEKNDTLIKEIGIEGVEQFIENIYKGVFLEINPRNDEMGLLDTQVLKNGIWNDIEQKGFYSFSLSNETKIYDGNIPLTPIDANLNYKGHEVYVAVEKGYGDSKRAVRISFKKNRDIENPVMDDEITFHHLSNPGVMLLRNGGRIQYDQSTIVVKDTTLVDPFYLEMGEKAYFIGNQSPNGGHITSKVIEIQDRVNPHGIEIFYGRILSINPGMDFTVNPHRELQNNRWQYYATPKTFPVSKTTKIFNAGGLVNPREFVDYGSQRMTSQSGYIITHNGDTLALSMEQMGIPPSVEGEIFQVDTLNNQVERIHIFIKNGVIVRDEEIEILPNTIVLKNHEMLDSSRLKKGDRVKVLKNYNGVIREGHIVWILN
jgi:hypothetical protein